MNLPVITFFLLLILLFAGAPIWLAISIPAVIGIFSTTTPSLFLTATYGGLDSFPLMAIPFFILAGGLMEKGGISKRIVNFVDFFIGGFNGSICVTACVTCALFGAVSGSAIATSVCVGGIVLPTMEEEGYDKTFSAALLGVAGTIGALIPPSMNFILYGAATGVSVGDLFIGGIIPGLLVTALLSVMAVILSKKYNPHYVKRERPKKTFWGFLKVLKDASLSLLIPVIILGGIYGGIFTPTEAGVVACIYAIILACFIYRTFDFKGLVRAFVSSTTLTCQTMFIVGVATAYARYLTLEGVPTLLSNTIRSMTDSPMMYMLLTVLLLLIIGTFMDVGAAMMVMAPIMHPIAMSYHISPLQYGVVMTMALIIGLTTPPVGSSLYVMASMTGLPFLDIAKKMFPFTLCYVIAMVLCILFEPLSTILVG